MEGINLVLMGRTGNGKSETGNSIVGRSNAFTARRSQKSVTKECKSVQRKWKDGRTINVIDTPGLFDTSVTKKFIDKEIVKCINLAKDGLHGVILVLSTSNRFTEEEANVLDNLQMLFGPRILNYMMVVFTGGDQLENDGLTLEDYFEECPQNLKGLLRRCNSRMVLFNNKATSEIKECQVAELLKQVNSIIAENESQPYSNELFAKAQAMASQLFYIRDKERSYEEQTKRLNELMEQNIRATEERAEEISKILGEKLASAESKRKHAEEEAWSEKQKSEAEILRLQEELKNAKKILHCSQVRGKVKCPCGIL